MKYSLSEYILYINLRLLALIFQALPVGMALFIGRVLGMFAWCFDFKHKRIAYRNLRIALAKKYSVAQLRSILKMYYQNFGMNIVETLRLPGMNKDYFDRYIKVQGGEYLEPALKNKTGVIPLAVHFGSWELYFAIAEFLRYPLYILAEEQRRNLLLDKFLTQIRQGHGVNVLKVGDEPRRVIRALQEGKFVAMVADHGIKEGIFVDFFGRKTRTSTIAVRIALKFNIPISVVYLRRIKGAQHELVILPPLEIKRTGNLKQDIVTNLEAINRIVQGYITKYPEQYLWFYKRFKYSSQRNILVLHDGKTGHLRQAQAIIKLIENIAKQKGLEINTKLLKIDFKNKAAAILQCLSVGAVSRYSCQSCLLCLKAFLKSDCFKELESYFADIVISCGSSAAAVNFVISNENQAKSIVLMRPGLLSTKKFNLVVMPAHDNPPKRSNIVVTDGALNLIDEEYMDNCASQLAYRISQQAGKQLEIGNKRRVLGLLLGGDTKRFRLGISSLKEIILKIKAFLEKHDGQILITTSRRTSPEVEHLIKQEFANYNRCRLLVIANENNIPGAVGGILGLSKIVIISPESISMISEAATSGRYVVVFSPQRNIGRRHTQFLEHFARKKYIYLSDSFEIGKILDEIVTQKPEIVKLQDSLLVKQSLQPLL